MSLLFRVYQVFKSKIDDLISAEGLKGRVFRGGAWLGAGSAVEQVIRFGRNMLLTRLLAPAAFGTMAIVLSATTLLGVLAEVGAREALIQNPRGTEDEYVTAAWWLSVGRALLIYAVVFLAAPFVARFYGNAELCALARVATFSIVFEGLMSPRAIVAMKQMKYARWASIQNGGGIVGVLVTIGLSFFIQDVWALALGYCSENAVRCALSYALCPYRPHFSIDRPALRDLLHFSKGLFGLALLNLIFTRADIFILGKIFPASALGLYSMSVYLVQTPTVFFAAVLGQTLLPALSRIQDDNDRMNRVLVKAASVTLMLGLPLTMFVAFCGRSLLTLTYGARYSSMAYALAAAAICSFINVLNVQLTLMFYAKGTPHLHRRSVAAMAIVVLALVLPFAKGLGVWAGQLACLVAVIIGFLLQLERMRHVTGLRLAEYARCFGIPLLASIAVAAVWLAARPFPALQVPIANVGVGLVGAVIAYGLAAALFYRDSTRDLASPVTVVSS